jgi:hypothetical protein
MTLQHRIHPDIESLDVVSQRLLPILRHFLASMQGDSKDGWQVAFATAEEIWGEGHGLAIAHRTATFLSALLEARQLSLDVADPHCVTARLRLTEDEFAILTLLAHARADEPSAARDLIGHLTGGKIDARVIRTVVELTALLGGTPDRRRCNPRLRAV